MELVVFTICLSSGCISFLVHALLSAMLLPVCHRRGGTYIFRRGAGHTLNCRVWPQEHKIKYAVSMRDKTSMFLSYNAQI